MVCTPQRRIAIHVIAKKMSSLSMTMTKTQDVPEILYEGEISVAEKIAAFQAEVLRLSAIETEELDKEIAAMNAKAAAVAEEYAKEIAAINAKAAAAAEDFSKMITDLVAKKAAVEKKKKKSYYVPIADKTPEEAAATREKWNASKRAKKSKEAAPTAAPASSPTVAAAAAAPAAAAPAAAVAEKKKTYVPVADKTPEQKARYEANLLKAKAKRAERKAAASMLSSVVTLLNTPVAE